MNSGITQIELTDQELEQITGGANPNFGLGLVSSQFALGTGGPSGSGVALGFGQGNNFGLGFANDQSFGSRVTGPLGVGSDFAYSGGNALGFGF